MFSLRTASSFTSRNIASAPPASTFMSIHYWVASVPSQENASRSRPESAYPNLSCPLLWPRARRSGTRLLKNIKNPHGAFGEVRGLFSGQDCFSLLLVPTIRPGWCTHYVPSSQTEDHHAR